MKEPVTRMRMVVSPEAGAGGYGAVPLCGEHRPELSRRYRRTTSQRMEIMAGIAGLHARRRPCTRCAERKLAISSSDNRGASEACALSAEPFGFCAEGDAPVGSAAFASSPGLDVSVRAPESGRARRAPRDETSNVAGGAARVGGGFASTTTKTSYVSLATQALLDHLVATDAKPSV